MFVKVEKVGGGNGERAVGEIWEVGGIEELFSDPYFPYPQIPPISAPFFNDFMGGKAVAHIAVYRYVGDVFWRSLRDRSAVDR